MKVFFFLIVCTLIIYANTSSTYCLEKTSASSAYDCQGLAVSTPGGYCCYYRFATEFQGYRQEYSTCAELSPADYNDIWASIQKAKDDAAATGVYLDVYSLDCKSSYLALSLFSLLLFIL